MEGDTGQDGVTLVVEVIQGPAEAIVVEFVGRDVPEEIGTGALGPVSDIDEGDGLGQACGDEQAEDSAAGELSLRIGRKMAINYSVEIHLL
jgi:hypothetical protein